MTGERVGREMEGDGRPERMGKGEKELGVPSSGRSAGRARSNDSDLL